MKRGWRTNKINSKILAIALIIIVCGCSCSEHQQVCYNKLISYHNSTLSFERQYVDCGLHHDYEADKCVRWKVFG